MSMFASAFRQKFMSTPTRTVPAGEGLLYFKSDGKLYKKIGTIETVVDGGAIDDTGWITPTLVNGWVVYNAPTFPTPGYRKRAGVVFLKGLVANGTGTIFTLPAGYRPGTGTNLFTSVTGNNSVGRTDVVGTGAVIASAGNNASWSLNGISFIADN